MRNLSLEFVSECLSYNSDSGALTWKRRPPEHFKRSQAWKMWNARYAGQEAGSLLRKQNTIYRQIKIDGQKHLAHRLAYLLYHGEHPVLDIDHRDGDGLNNRSDNLRLATESINGRNVPRRRDNSSGVTGVNWDKLKCKWRAQIKIDGTMKNLGCFTNKADAIATRQAAQDCVGGFTARHGKPRSMKLVSNQ